MKPRLMKRSASPARRPTRASSRRKMEEENKKADILINLERKIAAKAARAEILTSTPLLKALPLVLSSGFLCLDHCLAAASTCQNWYHIWKDAEIGFPEACKVEIIVMESNSKNGAPAHFIHRNDLLATIKSSPEFVRQIFDKISELRVETKKGPTTKKRCRENLPVWGKDIRYAGVLYWGRNRHNDGGICIDYYKSGTFKGSEFYGHRSLERVRVNRNLSLWTVKGMQAKTLYRVYDGEPLWP